ncbi:MAG: dTMP kinase [Limnobacter sp.]|nr:dTMP kinase [Limnobacter sp.]
MARRGHFLSFEGVDGAGKSSHIHRVQAHLQNAGIEIVLTREPGGTSAGEALRELVLHNDMDLKTELMLMYAARQQHVKELIEPSLDAGKWVLSDRFEDSSFAYQVSAGGLDWSECQSLSKWTLKGFKPDLTFLFDLSLAVAKTRIGKRGAVTDRFESKPDEYFEAVRKGFLKRAKQEPTRITLIDASKAEEEVGATVIQHLSHFMLKHRVVNEH